MATERQRILGGGCLLAAAAAAAYSDSLRGPFVFDDIGSILENPTLRHFGSSLVPPPALTVSGRPLLNLSLALNHAVSGTEVWSYHALNLLIHICAGLVLFGIVRRTARRLGRPGPEEFALAVALLWMVHPLQTESVTYVVQRAESLMGLCYLFTLYAFVRAAEGGGRRWLGWSWLTCLCGMATKEVMVTAPLVVFLYDRTFISAGFRDAWARRKGYYLALALTWIPLILLALRAGSRGGSAGFGTLSWFAYARIQVFALCHYLRLGLWPRPLVFYYGAARGPGGLAWVCDAALLAGLAAVTVAGVIRRSWWGFLGAAFFILLAPSSSVLPIASETLAEHRLYLALAPLAVLVVAALTTWAGRRPGLVIALAFGAVLAVGTFARNRVYASAVGLWSDTVASVPGNPVARNDLGEALRAAGRLGAAESEFRAAARLNPGYADAHNNLGVVLTAEGRAGEALPEFAEALRLQPGDANAWLNWGGALENLGRLDQAAARYRAAERIEPDAEIVHFDLGQLLLKQGRAEEAAAELGKAVRLDPSDAQAHNNLGVALGNLGRLREARAEFERAIALRPDYAVARANLARAQAGAASP